MAKRIKIVIVLLLLLGLILFTGFGIYRAYAGNEFFDGNGVLLQPSNQDEKYIGVTGGEAYKISKTGMLNFIDKAGAKRNLKSTCFLFYEDGSVMAMSDGVLLDFNDISDNFINNYSIPAKLIMTTDGRGNYNAETADGSYTFGENLWKLYDDKYLIQSPSMHIVMSTGDVREAGSYVQVYLDDTGVAYMLTSENLWMTISEETYIETEKGVRIYPILGIIDDGANKMSINKLTVGIDDQIALIPSETRRQIVPKLNIETIDGEDGDNGGNGQDGKDGINGQDGEAGETGKSGTAGAAGSSGSDGAVGGRGKNGPKGDQGASAIPETSVYSALPTMTFKNWVIEADRVYGVIHVEDEGGFLAEIGSNDALKDKYGCVKIYDEVTGEVFDCYEITKSVGGDIFYVGPEDFAAETATVNFDDFYKTTSTQPEVDVVFASDINKPLKPDTRYRISVMAYYAAGVETGTLEVFSREFISRYFYTDSLGANLYEKKAYTDSVDVGVTLGSNYVLNTDHVTVYLFKNQDDAKSYLGDSDNGKLAGGPIVLEVAEGDGVTSVGGVSGSAIFTGLEPNRKYYARVKVTTGDETSRKDEMSEQILECTTLKLPIMIDGDINEWDTQIGEKAVVVNDGIKVYYNRTNGRFEVFRPEINDPNDGITRYVYTPIRLTTDENGNVKEELLENQAIIYNRTDKEPASFLPVDKNDYKFKVDIYFDNNETEVKYERVSKDTVAAIGTGLPKVELVAENNFPQYNAFQGNVRLTMSYDSALIVEPYKQLTVTIVGDGIIVTQVAIEDHEQWYDRVCTPVDRTYTVSEGAIDPFTVAKEQYHTIEDTNYNKVDLGLLNLKKNTEYTINIKGYIDLNDGHGVSEYNFDTVNFRTPDTPVLSATWTPDPNKGDRSFSELLKIGFYEEDDPDIQAWVKSQLRYGIFKIQMYNTNGKPVGSPVNIKTEAQIDALFGEGLALDDAMFPDTPSTGFYFNIEKVYDQSYFIQDGEDGLGYANDFIVKSPQSETIRADAKAPQIPEKVDAAIEATEIYNTKVDAAKYGFAYDEGLPDDAVVGFRLSSTYNNTLQLGEKIHYYAMEYYDFYDCLTRDADPTDPLRPVTSGGAVKLAEATLDFTGTATPSVALIFGGTKGNKISGGNSGVAAYYTGPLVKDADGNLTSGMDRGYHYVFACTVQYNLKGKGNNLGTRYLYPYGTEVNASGNPSVAGTDLYAGNATYMDAVANKGCGYIGNTLIGKDIACVLNSGMQNAPKVTPKFVGYVYDAKIDNPKNYTVNEDAIGHTEIHYSFKDFDNSVSDSTLLYYSVTSAMDDPNDGKVLLTSDPVIGTSGTNSWYKATIPYAIKNPSLAVDSAGRVDKAFARIRPWIEISKYEESYAEEYAAVYANLTDAEKFANTREYIFDFPVEWDWGGYIVNQIRGSVTLSAISHYDQNYIEFRVEVPGDTESVQSTIQQSPTKAILLSRAYGIKVQIQIDSSYTGDISSYSGPKIFYLPFIDDGSAPSGTARLDLANIAEFQGKPLDFSKSSLLFDGGASGWKYADSDNVNPQGNADLTGWYGLQYTYDGVQSTFDTAYYVNGSSRDNIRPNGALFKTVSVGGSAGESADVALNLRKQFNKDNLYKDMLNRLVSGHKLVFDFKEAITNSDAVTERNIYPWLEYGVNIGANDVIGSGYVVPKNCVEMEFNVQDRTGGGFGSVVPIIRFAGYEAGSNSVVLNPNFAIVGYTETKDYSSTDIPEYRVYAAVFPENVTYEEVMTSLQSIDFVPKTMVLSTTGPQEGELYGPDNVNDRVLGNMESDSRYFVAFYVQMKDGTKKLLLDDGKTKPDGIEFLRGASPFAIYQIDTAEKIKIESRDGVIYTKNSYFDKDLHIAFTLSRSYRIGLEYEIYGSDQVTSKGAIVDFYNKHEGTLPDPLMDNAAVTSLAAILPGVGTELNTTRNDLTLDLKPDENRAELVPGRSYYLVIKAIEDGQVVGCNAFPFLLEHLNQVDAMIYTNSAQPHSISYKVTIIDDGYSIMGPESSPKGLYAVRFTDAAGNLIPTIYDDQIFSAARLREDFILSDSTTIDTEAGTGCTIQDNTIELVPGDVYKMNIYAVVDENDTGLSYETGAGRHDWKYFFDCLGTYWQRFKELINSFWKDDRTPDESKEDIEKHFMISQKLQQTLPSDKPLMNLDKSTIGRSDQKAGAFRLQLREAFGFFKEEAGGAKVPVYRLIKWSIRGEDKNGNVVSRSGKALYSAGDILFVESTENATDYQMITFEFPVGEVIPDGSYEITIQAFANENGEKTDGIDFTFSEFCVDKVGIKQNETED